jgi:GntR family transcriptional regulator
MDPGLQFTIDRQQVLPLYFQIQQHLLKMIVQGRLKGGDSLPSEQEISRTLRVSRMTARQALKCLCNMGVAYSFRGKGTFVSGIKLEKNIRQVQSFTEEMATLGHQPSSKVLLFEIVPADEEVAGALHLGLGEDVFSLRRVRMTDGCPVGIEWSHIPVRLCPDLKTTYDPQTSLYQALWERYGVRMLVADEIVEAGLASAADARLLQIDRGSPVFLFTRTSFVQAGAPVEYVTSVYRGDRYKIVNRLTRVHREFWTSPAKPV